MGAQRARALRAAFPRTLPAMAGYLFLGLAWGIVLRVITAVALVILCVVFWQHYQKDRAAFEKKKQAEKAAQPEEKKPDDTGNDTW